MRVTTNLWISWKLVLVPRNKIYNFISGDVLFLSILRCSNLYQQQNVFSFSSQEDIVLDPMSGNPLKIKKLIDVHFTPIKDDDKKKSLITKDVSFYFHTVITFWHENYSFEAQM